ncbi:MAG: hypothetical protein M1285_02900 [Candidatus Thermoplasmatota archaeon]|nr:hypothetical protein [Candidatus Thermoplasmatota archaeon]
MLKLTKPPYADTKVDAERTQQEITQLLRKYGVSQVNWQVNYDLEQVQLDFVIEYQKREDQSIHRVAVRVKPPMFAATRRTWDSKLGRYKKEEMANWARAYRMLYAYVKAKVEAIAYGMHTIEEEFMPDIIVRGEDGYEITLADAVLKSKQFAPMLDYKGGK